MRATRRGAVGGGGRVEGTGRRAGAWVLGAMLLLACADGGDPAGFVPEHEEADRAGAAADSTGSGGGGAAGVCANGTAVPNPGRYPDLVADCEVLLSVKDSLRGTGALNWDAGTAIGDWDGVTVAGSRVTRIELRERELTGVVPGGLGSLSRLERLQLEYNDLTGAIPAELGDLAELRWLWLFGNELTGAIPPELARAGSLSRVDLSLNGLTGTIPSGFGDLAQLVRLRLSANELTGTIPPELGEIQGLERLYLSANRLTGTIPAELAKLSRLKDLLLSRNDLTGAIPPELGGLARLTRLHLDVNELTGAIPPELGELANLEELLLGWNDLTGAIPPELGDLSGLKSLRMQSNELTGAIPPGLGGLARLERLHLNLNRLTGRIPGRLTLLTSLQDVRMDGNGLDGCVARDLSRFTSGINPQADGRDLPPCRPNVLVSPVEGLVTTERNGKAAVFDVVLEDRPEADVRIALSSSDPGEGVVSPTKLVIRSDVWYDSRSVTVRGVDDDARDGDQEYTAVLAPVESGDPAWRGVDPPDVRLTNRDDEPEGAPRIGLFVAQPRTIPAGGEASLLWRVRGATSIRIEPGVGAVTGSEAAVRPDTTTTYTLTAANVDGETTAEATVTVVAAPVIRSFRAEPDTIARGDTARLAWRVENAEVVFVDRIEVADSAQLAVAPQTTTSYELVAINYAGAVPQTARALATLTVVANGPPAAQIVIRDCRDGNHTCTYDATGSTDPEDNIESYRWDMGDGTTLAGATVEHGYAEPGRYTVTLTATDRFGAAGAADTVQVANLPPAAGFASTCAQLECTFTSTSTDDGGIERWAWDFGDGRTGSGPAATHGYAAGGGYEVALTATDSLGAEASASRTVTVAPLPVVGAFSATPETIAQGDTARLVWEVDGAETVFIDGNNVTDSTELAVAPDTTTTYALTATNAVGDSVTAEATVTVVPPPAVVSFRAVPETIARGGTARLVWEVEGAEAVFVDGNDVTDDTELAVAPDTTTTYTLTATNAVGDTATAQATVAVVVNRPPEARIAIRDCEDGNYACTYDASGSTDPDGNIASYGWDMGDGTTLAGATVEHGYAAPGRYTVALTVTDSAGARGTADAVQVVNRPPEANFASACTQLECTFTSTSTDDGGIERWAWDFGDGATGSGATATHAYAAGGSYDVTLSVTDGLGAEDDATRTVTVALRPVIDSFRATPDRITRGDTARLGWQVRNAESVLINPGVGNVTDSTEASVAPDTTTTYTLTAVNAIGDSATAQVTVTVVAAPVLGPLRASDTWIFHGQQVTLTWPEDNVTDVEINGRAVSGGRATVTPPAGTTTYRLRANDLHGSPVDGGTVTVTSVARPVLGPLRASDTWIFHGQQVTLTWPEDNVTDVEINGRAVSGGRATVTPPAGTTTYRLRANDLHGSPVDGGTVTVTSVARPVLGPLRASDTWIFHGQQVTLTWPEDNVTDVEINGRAVSGGRATVTPPAGTTTYRLRANDLHGSPVDGGTVTVTSVARPVLGPLRASDTWIFHGQQVTLTWREDNVTDVEINGSPVSGGRTTVNPGPGTTTYRLTANDLHGSPVDGGTVTVTSVARPVLGPLRASDTWIFHGQQVTLTWREDNVTDVEINGSAVSGGRTTVTPPAGTTTYRLRANDLHGSPVDGGTVTVTSVARPVLELTVSDDWIFRNDRVTLSWTAENVRNPRITAVPSRASLGPIQVGRGSREVTPPLDETTYTLRAQDLHGNEVDPVTVTVTSVERPVLDLTVSDDWIFRNDRVTLSWTAENVRNPRITAVPSRASLGPIQVGRGSREVTPPLGETTYTLRAQDLHGNEVDPVTVTVTSVERPVLNISARPDAIYTGRTTRLEWTALNVENPRINGSRVATGTGLTQDKTPRETTTYTLSADGDLHGNPVPSVNVRVRVEDPPDLGISVNPNLIPKGRSTTLTWTAENVVSPRINGSLVATGTDLTRPERPDSTMTYTLSADSSALGNAVASVRATVEVDQPPMASFTFSCDGLTCDFDSDSEDDRTSSLQHRWTFGDGGTSSQTAPTHTYGSRRDYLVVLTVTDSPFGQTNLTNRQASVSENPVPSFVGGCGGGLSCSFSAANSSDDGSIESYSWDFGDGGTGSGREVDHTYSAHGTYTVELTVTDDDGQSASTDLSLTTGGPFRASNTPPTVDFTTACNGLECTFTSTSTDDTGIVAWEWSTGDDAAAGTKAVHTHRYASAGTYRVMLAVRDAYGGFGVIAYRVTVTP